MKKLTAYFVVFAFCFQLLCIQAVVLADASLSIEIKNGTTVKASSTGSSSVSLTYQASYEANDMIVITSSITSPYLKIKVDDQLDESLVYVPGGRIRYPVPATTDALRAYKPNAFLGNNHQISVSMATEEEIYTYRNIAKNPADKRRQAGITDSTAVDYNAMEYYPHATANAVTNNSGTYEERNTIDGSTETGGHDAWPYQSWGGGLSDTLEYRLDFGRTVEIDKIDLYLRADYTKYNNNLEHDTYWEAATIQFSDGSTKDVSLVKGGNAQTITFETKRVNWIKLVNLKRHLDSTTTEGYAALTEIEVYGKDVNPNALLLTKSDVIKKMEQVNDYWIGGHANPGWVDWKPAVYFEGDIAMYRVYPKKSYYNYAVQWGNNNSWGITEPNNILTMRNADNQCCGQTYIDLYQYSKDSSWISKIATNIDAEVADPNVNFWTWIDAIQMAMPTFAKLGAVKNDTKYFDKMYQLYSYTKNDCDTIGLYAANTGSGSQWIPPTAKVNLWWRDGKYNVGSVPNGTSPNGKLVFWSRGNGWVFAALARVLDVLPDTDPHYNEYLQDFKNMALEIKNRQLSNGFWHSNLDDADDCPGPEVTGTSMFTYGLAWGINKGILNQDEYLPTVKKAWNAMVNTAVHPDGFLGYVQIVAEKPGTTTYDTTADFGVGVFLLAGSEVVKLADGPMPEPDISYLRTYKVGNTDNAGSLEPNQLFTANLNVGNPRNTSKSITFIAGLYDSAGKLQKIAANREVVEPNSTKDVSVSFDLPGQLKGYYCKIYVWDMFDNMKPILPPATVIYDTATTFPIQSATASDYQNNADGVNPPGNAIDNNYSTRWAALGEQWIQFDLGAVKKVTSVNVAVWKASERKSKFDIYVSADGDQWENVFSGTSSLQTETLESYKFPEKNARYIRINGHGNTVSSWNSILEVTIIGNRE